MASETKCNSIVKFYDHLEFPGNSLIVMENLEMDLYQYLIHHPKRDDNIEYDVLRLLNQMAEALKFLKVT